MSEIKYVKCDGSTVNMQVWKILTAWARIYKNLVRKIHFRQDAWIER